MTDAREENGDEQVTPNEIEDATLKVEVTNQPKEKEEEDKTSWETEDEWDILKMTKEDIKQAEESRNA